MSLPCSDQSIRPKKMKDASLPPGVELVRCWCGSPCKVKEVTDFSDMFGMKFFMCPNHEHDPPVVESPYEKPPVCFNHDEQSNVVVFLLVLMNVYFLCFSLLRPYARIIVGLTRSSRNGRCVK